MTQPSRVSVVGSRGHLLPALVEELLLWKTENPKAKPDSFIFPNTRGGLMDTKNYRNRVLMPLAEKLGAPKVNFQSTRRDRCIGSAVGFVEIIPVECIC
jgi:hypothetical protein